jgi:hypothetical protein
MHTGGPGWLMPMTITIRDDDGHLVNHELQPANPKRPI